MSNSNFQDLSSKLLVTSTELSQLISIPTFTIRKLTREGILPAISITGRTYLYDPSEVLLSIKKYRLQNSPTPPMIESTRANISPKGVDA